MFRGICLSCILALIAIAPAYDHASAAWVDAGTPVCTAPQDQYAARMVGDGAGNFIASWLDYRHGYWEVYAQKFDQWGDMLWTPDGVRVGLSSCTESPPGGVKVVTICNEYGETIIAWYGIVGGVIGPCVQLLSPDGDLKWGSDGILVCPGTMRNTGPALATGGGGGGGGGALVAWVDTRGADSDVYIQNLDREGRLLWDRAGVPVCTASGNQLDPMMTSDLRGGAEVAWADLRNGKCNFYAQRVTADGVALWASNGVPVTTWALASTLSYPSIITDAKGGVIITWRDFSFYSSESEIFSQRIDAGGNAKWATGGMPICTAASSQAGPAVVPDGIGGAYITWYDYRSYQSYDVYAQRIDSLGSRQWAYDGVPICTAPGWQVYQAVSLNPLGGVTIAWQDQRGPDKDVYAQRLDGSGNPLWTENGVRLCMVPGDQTAPDVRCLDNGDAAVIWHDQRAGNFDIYAQKVRADGSWASHLEEPIIAAVKDIPGDEGGFVRLKVRASVFDQAGEALHPITYYNVWRRMDHPFLADASASGALSASAILESIAKGHSEGLRVSRALAPQLGFPAGDWESIGLHAAVQDSVYYFVAATLRDSTAADPADETYVVSAHTATPSLYYVSAPGSGHSVDNLAPGTPTALAGQQCSNPVGLVLTWARNPEPDMGNYALYRGNSTEFVPGPDNLLAETANTYVLDGAWSPGGGWCYKLVAIDRHGNRSDAALLMSQDVIATMLQSFSASAREQFVEVSWTVSAEDEGCVFYVLRRDAWAGEYRELSGSVARSGLGYSFQDASAEPGKTYQYRVEYAVGADRKLLFETGAVSMPIIPLTLYQNFPNPFNPATTIRYYLPDAAVVKLDVYDAAGRLVARLVDREMKAKGAHEVRWGGEDGQGKRVASGVYIYRLETGKSTVSKKMILLK
jgi:hypothetical protein